MQIGNIFKEPLLEASNAIEKSNATEKYSLCCPFNAPTNSRDNGANTFLTIACPFVLSHEIFAAILESGKTTGKSFEKQLFPQLRLAIAADPNVKKKFHDLILFNFKSIVSMRFCCIVMFYIAFPAMTYGKLLITNFTYRFAVNTI